MIKKLIRPLYFRPLVTIICSHIFLFHLSFSVIANSSADVKKNINRSENIKKNETLILPYVFSTDDLGFMLGVGGMSHGLMQPQMSVGGTVFFGSDYKSIGFGVWDYQLFKSDRFFVSAVGMVGD